MQVWPRAAEKPVDLAAAAYWASRSSRGPASVAVLSIMATIPEVTDQPVLHAFLLAVIGLWMHYAPALSERMLNRLFILRSDSRR
jgi:hypothetical protein